MIQPFVDKFMESKDSLFVDHHPDSYHDIVKAVVETISGEDDYWDFPDPNRIHVINDGDYQGTLIFVIGAKGYQPSTYWYVRVYYGSCSGCDTLQAINGYSYEPPTPEQTAAYQTLALHIIQRMKRMDDDS